MELWRKLSVEEEAQFKAWARANYKPGARIEKSWHPVVQIECIVITAEDTERSFNHLGVPNGWL